MNENSDLLPNLHHEEFEMQMRGYSRRQVDEYVARRNNEIRDLEQRLAHALDEAEHLRREISIVRQQALAGRPAHEELSERMAQILKLAEDEAKAQRAKTEAEVTGLRNEAQRESERVRTDAREQAERMLNAAQEQAERTISAARAESEKMRSTARTEAEQLASESRKQADSTLSEAKSQAKRMVDEATARASAIHDGAERRLSLLSTRHAETVRRLTDILEGVQGLVAAESARMSLEEEVRQSASTAIAALEPAKLAEGSGPAHAVPSGPAKDRDLGKLPTPAPETAENGTAARPAPGPGSGPLPTRPVTAQPATAHSVTIHPVTVHRDLPSGAPGGRPTGTSDTAGTPESASATRPAEAPGTGDTPAATGTPGTPGNPPAPPPAGRHATPLPPPSAMPRRHDVQQTENPQSSQPAPGGPIPGPARVSQPTAPGPNGFPPRETQPDSHQPGSGTGPGTGPSSLIDPDEPTEGFRLMR